MFKPDQTRQMVEIAEQVVKDLQNKSLTEDQRQNLVKCRELLELVLLNEETRFLIYQRIGSLHFSAREKIRVEISVPKNFERKKEGFESMVESINSDANIPIFPQQSSSSKLERLKDLVSVIDDFIIIDDPLSANETRIFEELEVKR